MWTARARNRIVPARRLSDESPPTAAKLVLIMRRFLKRAPLLGGVLALMGVMPGKAPRLDIEGGATVENRREQKVAVPLMDVAKRALGGNGYSKAFVAPAPRLLDFATIGPASTKRSTRGASILRCARRRSTQRALWTRGPAARSARGDHSPARP